LPGYGDNIRLTEQQTLLVPFAIVKNYDLGKYGLLAEYDLNGKPLKSWHDPTGKIVQGSSQAFIYENKLYLGSLLLDYVAVVDY
jgi:hypothetical protein